MATLRCVRRLFGFESPEALPEFASQHPLVCFKTLRLNRVVAESATRRGRADETAIDDSRRSPRPQSLAFRANHTGVAGLPFD